MEPRSDFPIESGLPRAGGSGPVLRRTQDRAAWCEGEAFVKAYRARSRWKRLGDRRRARVELRCAAELAAAKICAPRPLDVAVRVDPRGRRHRVVRLERLEGCTLDEFLSRSPAPPEARAIAEACAATLAALHRSGRRHRDLHPGNLFVRAGSPSVALLDLRAIARGDSSHDLVRLASETIGRASPRTLLRFLRAYNRAVGRPSGRARLVANALRERDRNLERGLDRWLRPSSRVVLQDGALLARELTPAGVRVLEGALGEAGTAPPSHEVVRGPRARVRERWLDAARAAERARFGVPAERVPLLLRESGPESRCVLGPPP